MKHILMAAALAGGLSTGAVMAQAPPPALPTFTAPAENSMLVNVSIRWQGVSGASHYGLCLRETVTGACVLEQPNLSGTSFNLSPVPEGLRGKRLFASVRACGKVKLSSPPNCSNYNVARSFYVMGPVQPLQDPADGSTYAGSDRRPTFSWPAYAGFDTSSQPGTLRYRLTISGTGAAATVFDNLMTTSFKPPTALNSQYQNPIRWGVQACTTVNCSAPGGTRTLTVPGTAPTTWGPVQLHSPASSSTVDTGSKLSWLQLPNAATYRVCLHTQASGCRLQLDVPAGSGTPQQMELTPAILDMRENPLSQVHVFRNNAGSATLKTMYWSVTACNAGNTQCTSPGTTPQQRTVLVANAPATTTPSPSPTDALLSFAQHLYPVIASPDCSACHPGTSLYPQRTGPSDNASSAMNELTTSIPFSTADSASTMRSKFLGLVARSTDGNYAQALGKVYVVPGNSGQSGLHWKAQQSTAAAFSSNHTIGSQTKPLKEWIRIWIDQGAAP